MKDRTISGTDENTDMSYDSEQDRYREGDSFGRSDSAERDRFREDEFSTDLDADERPLSDRRPGDDVPGGRVGSDSFTSDSMSRPTAASTAGISVDEAPLFSLDDSERFRARWKEIQTNFVDEPRRSVEEADELVAEVTDQLTAAFKRNRDNLERQWTAGDEVSTENLRQSLQHYRSFFERLLSM